MASNKLTTEFVYNDRDGAKLDARVAKLKEAVELENKIGTFGNNPTFGTNSALTTTVRDAKDYLSIQAKTLQNETASEKLKRAALATQRESIKLEREKLSLQNQTSKNNSFGLPNQTRFNGDTAFRSLQGNIFKSLADGETSLEKLRAKEVAAIEAQTLKNKQQNADMRKNIARRLADAEIAEERRVERAKKQIADNLANSLNPVSSAVGKGRAASLLSGVGLTGISSGLATAGGIGLGVYGIQKFIEVSGVAIEKTIAADRANRLLASSATEAGIAYAELAEKNKKSGEIFGLSDVKAASVTAKIQQLATFTGKPQQFDVLQKRFADLGAAKGIDSNDLSVLIGTILSGQDEGLNRLGISDPGQLYKAYAKEIGKTTETLTQYEKVQAAVNAVVAKGAIFDGTASARMNSLEGSTARVTKEWENFTTSLSKSYARSYELNAVLSTTNKILKNLTVDTDELQKKQSKGLLTDADITNAAKPGVVSDFAGTALKGFYQFMSGFSTIVNTVTLRQSSSLNQSSTKFADASVNLDPEYQQIFREAELRIQLNNQILLDAQQKKDAAEQKQIQRDKLLIDGIYGRIDGLKKLGGTLADISKIEDEIYLKNQNGKNIAKFGGAIGNLLGAISPDRISDANALEAFKKASDERRRLIIDEQKESITNFLQSDDPTISGAREIQRNLIKNSGFLNDKDFLSLNKEIEDFVKKTKKEYSDLRDEFRTSLISSGEENNPFVKLISEVDSVAARAEKQFGKLGEAAVKAAVETSNATKLLNEGRFNSNLSSLRFNQESRRLLAQPETYFADFQRRLERIERESAFISNTNQLSRQISETETALRFNPNNPKSLEEIQRRFAGDDASIRNALSDISGLRSISTNGTGAFGESAVAGEVLKVLPSLNDLVSALNNPKLAGDARFLLNERSNALRSQRTGEQAKFRDFIENQKVSELGKRDAYEALNLLRNTNGLDRSFQLSQVLAITQELGNDLDPNLRRGRFEALKESAQIEANKERAAREYNARIENYLKNVVSALTSKGIVIEENSRGNTNVVVNSKDVEVDRSLGRSPTNFDTQETYDLGFAGGTNR